MERARQFLELVRRPRPEHEESVEDKYRRASQFERGIYTLEHDLRIPEALDINGVTVLVGEAALQGKVDVEQLLHRRLGSRFAENLTRPPMQLAETRLKAREREKIEKDHIRYFRATDTTNTPLTLLECELDAVAETSIRLFMYLDALGSYRADWLEMLHRHRFPNQLESILEPRYQGEYAPHFASNQSISNLKRDIAKHLSVLPTGVEFHH